MPNWAYNNFKIKGSEKNILAFLNSGLTNSNLPECDNIEDAVKALVDGATTKCVKDREKKFFMREEQNSLEITYEKGLTMRTFRPTPDTFLLYDTTNYAKDFPEEAKKQEEEYGAVGWYDYNVLTLGTKWNAPIEIYDYYESPDGMWVIECHNETAWSYPSAWLAYIAREFDVNIYGTFFEEGDFYALNLVFSKEFGEMTISDHIADITEELNAIDGETDDYCECSIDIHDKWQQIMADELLDAMMKNITLVGEGL